MYVEEGYTLKVPIRRKVPRLFVRYQWCISERPVTPINYLNGRCQTIVLHTECVGGHIFLLDISEGSDGAFWDSGN